MDNRPPAPKVAIPRLGRKSPPNKQGKPRVQKACENCRKRKVRCCGGQPHCRNCVDQYVPCVYSKARKDRLKEFVSRALGDCQLIPGRATEQNSQLIALLKDLNAHVDDEGQKKIDKLFNSVYLLKSNASLVLIHESFEMTALLLRRPWHLKHSESHQEKVQHPITEAEVSQVWEKPTFLDQLAPTMTLIF